MHLINYIYTDIKQEIFIKVKKNLKTAKILKNYEYHDVGKNVFRDLLQSRELGYDTFEEFFNKPAEADEVLGYNVIAYHPEKDTVTFQSRSVEYYIQENIQMFS